MTMTCNSSPGVQSCQKCGFSNRAGVIFCEECGAPLDGKSASQSLGTRAMPPEILEALRESTDLNHKAAQVSPEKMEYKSGSPIFFPGSRLRLELEGVSTIVLTPLPGRALVVGRRDPESDITPEIDLAPYGANENGVSRRHAALLLTGKRLCISDLKSSNGTYLNDMPLDAHEQHQLRDGDQLRFGGQTFSIRFEK
jgi:hypothetical protein